MSLPFLNQGTQQLCSPISILPAMSKILEKVVTEQLVDYLESNQLLYPEQFEFRHKHSTETAICFFVENLKCFMDGRNVVGAMCLDLKKAFDTVNHSILLSRLLKFKISKQALNWFASYSHSRQQCVTIDQKKSVPQYNIGIPQVSILGPLLLTTCLKAVRGLVISFMQLYDDTVIYASAKTSSEAAEILSSLLSRVCHWLYDNKLTLNKKKTCFSIKTTTQ